MECNEVKKRVALSLPRCEIRVEGDGSHFTVTAIGQEFEGVSNLARQRTLFRTLKQEITSGAIHAVDVRGYTPQEWQQAQKLKIS
ncbi:MAG: BolA/IbaG family iron-sulfur metabolism protein [Gammaproteobacteria bacterium]|nr:BolA/IbaG family iron-sulfur metabolism protein [Gammaproteobacteria bacterium]